MKNKVYFLIVLSVCTLLYLVTKFDTLSWKEEVLLRDGRTIVVDQKRRYDGFTIGAARGIPREAWLEFDLPEFSKERIIWHENLSTFSLNAWDHKLYVVGFPPSDREFRQYGQPKPIYIIFRYDNKKWIRIPISEMPTEIYDANLFTGSYPHSPKPDLMSIDYKLAWMADMTYPKMLKRIDLDSQTY